MDQSQDQQSPSQASNPLRILLVDDEQAIRDLLGEYLSVAEGHQATVAGSGEEALAIFKKDCFDCAFLDLKMPGMSGVELLGAIKEIEPTLPVVIMTGYPSLDVAIDTMRQGASDFLIKPINPNQVKLTLERVVREHRLLQENLRLSERLRHQEKIEQLNRELERKFREQEIINQISEAIDRAQSSEAIYQAMADLSCLHLEAKRAAVLLLDRMAEELVVIASTGFEPNPLGRAACQVGKGLFSHVVRDGKPSRGDLGSQPAPKMVLAIDRYYLCMPVKIRSEVFGILVVADKNSGEPFQDSDVFLANFLLDKVALAIENIALYESMVANLHATLSGLVAAMEAKDPYTKQHSWRVTNLSVVTAQAMGLGNEKLESLRFAAYLHDIGKIGVKDDILTKPTSLTRGEYEEIKRHPAVGENIVAALDLSLDERAVIRHHHERWDGRGYPDGLSGDDIPLLARVVAVADAFDAMTSNRHYRKALERAQAFAELKRCAGSQFDPTVVSRFLEVFERSTRDEAVLERTAMPSAKADAGY